MNRTPSTSSTNLRDRGRFRRRPTMFAGALIVTAAIATGAYPILAQTSPTIDESEAEVFVALEPVRFLDTRIGLGADDRQLAPQETITLKIGGEKTVPAEATSVALSTAIPASATEEAFFTIWPTGTPQPFTSVNNANPGVAVPNFTLAKLGDNDSINIFNERGNSDFVIDVVGYYTTLDNVAFDQTQGGALLSGSGAPDDGLGDDGDGYIDLDSGDLYVKANGTFALVGPATTGGDVLTGSGPPQNTQGVNGDVYVDADTGRLYVKVDNVWIAAGTPTEDTDSALSATNIAGLIDLTIGTDTPLTFDTPGVSVGSAITQNDDDTFVLEQAGVYKVQFVLGTVDVGLLGNNAQVRVDGVDVGPSFTIAAAGVPTTGVLLVEAPTDGAELELVTDAAIGIGVLNEASIVIELIAAD